MENTIGRIDAVQILGNFAAKESASDGMPRITLDARGPAIFNRHQHRAGVGTIVRTSSMDNVFHESEVDYPMAAATVRRKVAVRPQKGL